MIRVIACVFVFVLVVTCFVAGRVVKCIDVGVLGDGLLSG